MRNRDLQCLLMYTFCKQNSIKWFSFCQGEDLKEGDKTGADRREATVTGVPLL